MHSSKNLLRLLGDQDVYPCPVCRLNQLKVMPLMDSMACDCCQNIFIADLERQQLKMPSRQPPLIWCWNGKNWTALHLQGVEWTWIYSFLGLGFALLPTMIIGLAAYTFPPTPDSTLSWLPVFWTGLTFFLHSAIILWLVIEFYQFPLRAYLRIRIQQFTWR